MCQHVVVHLHVCTVLHVHHIIHHMSQNLSCVTFSHSSRMQGCHGGRPVTLIGCSMGARLVFHCLLELARLGLRGCVENVILLGAPVSCRCGLNNVLRMDVMYCSRCNVIMCQCCSCSCAACGWCVSACGCEYCAMYWPLVCQHD